MCCVVDEEANGDASKDNNSTSNSTKSTTVGSKRPAVLADGTYASQAAVVETPLSALTPTVPNLRALLLSGDFFLGGVIAGTLTKLLLRLRAQSTAAAVTNRLSAQVMLVIVCMLRLGEAPDLPSPLDNDSKNRMSTCLQVLASPEQEMVQVSAGISSGGWVASPESGCGLTENCICVVCSVVNHSAYLTELCERYTSSAAA